MKKQINNSEMAKRNRANRKRGGNWEKRGADFLQMDVVPYSGSNARFGYGDVRDSIWLGEFKNITPDGDKITIKHEWLDKNNIRALGINHLPFLAWMPFGKTTKYIILDADIVSKLDIKADIEVEMKKASCKSVNLIFELNAPYMKHIKTDNGVILFRFGNELWYMLSIEFFKFVINDRGMKGVCSTV